MDMPIEKRFKVLCEISRAQHFAWREAALAMAPDVDPIQLVNKMWEIVGAQTAKAYLDHIDRDEPIAIQIAQSIRFSSDCMGEDVSIEQSDGDEALVKHHDCPWFHWHKRLGLLAEDQPGCDTWFQTIAREIGKSLDVSINIETRCSLPEGGDCCLRRITVERDR